MKETENKPEVKKVWRTPVLKELAMSETSQSCASGAADLDIIIN